MYAKIQITGKLELKTGMHIGGSSAFAAIGAVDAPVIKDIRTNVPMIPGSSLKGKLRTLLARAYNPDVRKPDDDVECLARLFGSAKKGNVRRSRVLVADMLLENEAELRAHGLQSMTEVKFENSINRATAVANPRQIERAVRGSRYELDIIYEIEEHTGEKDKAEVEEEVLADMKVLAEGFQLLQYDYLGGNGSRGYGKVVFQDLQADVVIGQMEKAVMDQCNKILQNVSA